MGLYALGLPCPARRPFVSKDFLVAREKVCLKPIYAKLCEYEKHGFGPQIPLFQQAFVSRLCRFHPRKKQTKGHILKKCGRLEFFLFDFPVFPPIR